jgi:hypothetical protein
MVPAFEEAVFSLKKSEISEPVKTPYGYHLIVVTGITPEEQLSYDRVKEGIRTSLLEQKIEQAWDSWLAQKRAQVGVVYRADLELEDSGSVESDTETTESDTETTEPDPETGEETPTTDTSAE